MITLEQARNQLDWEPQLYTAPRPSNWQDWNAGMPVGFEPDPKSMVLVRGNDVLGRVTRRYQPFYNADTINLVEAAVDNGWLIDSIKEFAGGKTVAVNLLAADDLGEHQGLVALVNSFTGRGSLRLLPLHRKIFCQNQFPLYSGSRSYRVQHSGSVEFPADAFGRLRDAIIAADGWMNSLRDVPVDFQAFMEALIDNTLDTEPEPSMIARRRKQLLLAYDDPTATEVGSAYAALQAVILADQRIIGRGSWRREYGSELSQTASAMIREMVLS